MKDRMMQILNYTLLIFSFVKSVLIKHLTYLAFSLVISWLTSNYVNMNSLGDAVSTLQNLSIGMFTLAGIWIAYSYPQAIAAYTKPDSLSVVPTNETRRIETLVLIVLTSAFVAISLITYSILSVLLVNVPYVLEHKYLFKLCAVGGVIYLSVVQVRAVLTIMLTNIEFIDELHNKKAEHEANSDL